MATVPDRNNPMKREQATACPQIKNMIRTMLDKALAFGTARARGNSGRAASAGVLAGMLAMMAFLPLAGALRAAEDPGAAAAFEVISRRIGNVGDTIDFSLRPSGDGPPAFRYRADRGRLQVEGNTPVALCRGFYDYMKSNRLGMVSWSGKRLAVEGGWPDCGEKSVVSPYQHHYLFNVVSYGYTMPYWDWARWEEEIDWMALHGYDMPLALVANEAISIRVWRRLGIDEEAIRKFYTGPAHLPWQRMGNLIDHDGPLPEEWHTGQVALQHKILKRMRSLGMKPIAPAFAGFVPQAIRDLYPDVKLHESSWGGFPKKCHAYLLMPDSDLFVKIGKMYIEEYEKEFGRCGYYLADSFNEMAIPAPKDDLKKRHEIVARFGGKVYESIKAGNPEATWVLQGWMFGYQRNIWDKETLRALVSKVPDDKMLLLDMATDYNALRWRNGMNWDFYDGFFGKPWVYSTIPNMGGKTVLNGPLKYYAEGHAKALESPNRGNLVGYGCAMEGFENNEMIYELVADMGWQREPANLGQWLENYCINRYGAYGEELKKCWEFFQKKDSCFSPDRLVPHPGYSWQSRPKIGAGSSAATSEDFLAGIEAFASAAPRFKGSALYRADLLEMAACFLGVKAADQIATAQEAYINCDNGRGDKASALALEMLENMDRLLQSHPLHRLDRWLDMARAHGSTAELKDYYESNARRIVTLWGPPVDDYSKRIWAGLVGEYYRERVRLHLDELKHGRDNRIGDFELKWVTSSGLRKVRPFGDPAGAAVELIHRYEPLKFVRTATPEGGSPIGGWSNSEANQKDWRKIEIEVPAGLIDEMIGIRFEWLKGNHRVYIRDIQLEMDGEPVFRSPRDIHCTKGSPKHFRKIVAPEGATSNNGCKITFSIRKEKEEDDVAGTLILVTRS